VHYSGNSIKLRTINRIQEILKVEPGNGFGTDLMTKDNALDQMFGNLDDRVDPADVMKAV